MIRQSSSASRPNRLANRKVSPFSRQSVAHAIRVMAPTLVALTFASAAHAQGTMDFSGAQTLMGTFKTFAIYAGAVICFGGLIFAGIRMMSGRFQDAIPGLFGALFGAGASGGRFGAIRLPLVTAMLGLPRLGLLGVCCENLSPLRSHSQYLYATRKANISGGRRIVA